MDKTNENEEKVNKDANLVPVKKSIVPDMIKNPIRRKEVMEKTGKILKNTGIALGGLVGSAALEALAVPALPVALGTVGIYGGFKAFSSAIYHADKSLLFSTRRRILKNDYYVSQDATQTVESLAALRGYDKYDKGAIMMLQLLAGLSNYKQKFALDNQAKTQDGVYPTIFATKTHSINLELIDNLEKMGFISIVEKGDPKQRMLMAEKIGFGNFSDLTEKRDFREVRFKLTDKPIDLEDIYLKLKGAREFDENEDPKSYRNVPFRLLRNLLDKGNVAVDRDEYGRYSMKFHTKEEDSFAKRMSMQVESGKARLKQEKTKSMQEPEKTQEVCPKVTTPTINLEVGNINIGPSKDKDDGFVK